MKIKLYGIRQIIINTDYIRLDALLKLSAFVSSGGEAKVLIRNGDVIVRGITCLQRGKKIRDGDVVKITGGDIIVVKKAE